MVTLRDLETPKALDAFLTRCDAQMRDEGVPVPRRPLEAWRRLQVKTQATLPFGGPWQKRIDDWYRALYGNRLDVWPSVRRVLVMLGGEPWVMSVPIVFGRAEVPFDTSLIEGATPELLRRTTDDEVKRVEALLRTAIEAVNHIGRLPAEAFDDWHTAVEAPFQLPPACGLSKWSSAQVVEKVLGKYIRHKGGVPPRTQPPHQLVPVAEHAETCGSLRVDRALLAAVDCRTEVRYRKGNTSAADAVVAHQAALAICSDVGRHW